MENEDLKPIFDEEGLQANAKIIVIGVGGGGSNAVNGMLHDKNDEVDYWVFNTDSQALANSPCDNKLILGRNVTRGLGAGGLPEMGQKAAEDSYNDIQLVVKGADMVFIAAGEGGGTGTGAAPVVARAAKEAGCLVLGIVTRPFTFEGKARKLHALEGISNLKQYVDALIVVSNDKMMFNNGALGIKNAFAASDEILAQSVKTVTDLILVHGVINLDFADVKATLAGKGLSLIGIGYGEGENKAIDAATNAINSPLLETSIRGSRSMIINITVGDDTTLDDVQYAINYITESAGGRENDVNIIFGVQNDESFHSKMKIAIIATDFEKEIDMEQSETAYNRSITSPAARVATPVIKEEPVNTIKKPEPVKSQVKEEIKEERESSVLPDYLRDFFADESEPVKPQTEITGQLQDRDPTTTFNSVSANSDDDDEDDAIVIDRKI
ncbi:MAG: cell division protein FtsZ [Bacilli bacterium]|nr:cell division protein FtsZ [Bacilli bacterium]